MKLLTSTILIGLAMATTVYAQSAETPLEPKTGTFFETHPITEGNLPTFFSELKAKMTYPLAYDGGDPKAWHDRVLPSAEALMLPSTDTVDFAPEVIDKVDRGDFTAMRVAFNVTDESRIAAIVLVPKGDGPFPGVLMLHDHGARFDIGKEKWIRPWYDEERLKSTTQWSQKYFSGLFPGEELAKRGYVVVATDALGWGDRAGNGYEAQQALASNLSNLGSSLAGIMAQEDVRASEFVASLPEVDPDRVGVVGFSMGAFRAWQVAALSPVVKATVADCWMATYDGLMVPGNNQLKGQSAWYMNHPGIARLMDYPDVAALAAPKALYFMEGVEDPLFPKASVEDAYAKMRVVWDAYNADDKLKTDFFDGGHIFTEDRQKAAFDWLDSQLK
ncbi:alpha/beta fold hydrolase [Martelella sp. HB161492]|uniref:dienelactone hydrolase family protein n=1 Tax=Martelella sp. HB161492 TaxID=2720726 RepID=UPI00159016C8|nr:alpha/beta fold hydrolase [Martelella sp. HB161492]